MNLYEKVRSAVIESVHAVAAGGILPSDVDTARVTVETPKDPSHGDMATNAAMLLAKPAGLKPRDLAEQLAEKLHAVDWITEVSVAGPGFLNLRLDTRLWHRLLSAILESAEAYGDSTVGAGTSVNIEYVSANPTGPLHAGHLRGAVVGDVLAALLEKAGYTVTREYYINDAGAQVDILARSAFLRYREALGAAIGQIPEGYYPGDYLKEVGAALANRDGGLWADQPEGEWLEPVKDLAITMMMIDIRRDLAALGIAHDVFTSERELVAKDSVQQALDRLAERGLIYRGILEPPKGKTPEDWEAREQTLFKATDFGDDVDRPLQKSDGSWTYFASDIAYHRDKAARGADILIDVMGADHGGYIKRMEAAVKAITEERSHLHVLICQLVHLSDAGKPVKLSKRAGNIITARDVIEAVGPDVVRFIMVTRRHDQALDFDFQKVKEQSKDNPVFYVQYAHARCCSVLRHAASDFPDIALSPDMLADGPLDLLNAAADLDLMRQLAIWPRVVESAAQAYEPHRIAFYLYDLASAFHVFWTKGKDQATLRVLLEDDPAMTRARLALIQAVRIVIASGLSVMGVKPVQEM